LSNRLDLDSPAHAASHLTPAQQTAARIVGLLYLLMMLTAMFGLLFVRGELIAGGDAATTAKNIAASERLFRAGAVSSLVTFVGDIVLLWALYVVLEPVNRGLALLAAFWRLGECCLMAVATLNDFTALSLLGGAEYLRPFDVQQLQGLAYTFLRAHGAGYRIGEVFLGLGSTVFAYLWLKSRYIPRALAALGVLGSLLVVVVDLAVMVFPGVMSIAYPSYWGPLFVFEIAMGVWLLVRGIRMPAVA
jgi:hypothetical protein